VIRRFWRKLESSTLLFLLFLKDLRTSKGQWIVVSDEPTFNPRLAAYWAVTTWQPADSKGPVEFRVTGYSIRPPPVAGLPSAYCPLL
jgi:hypothetical protein